MTTIKIAHLNLVQKVTVNIKTLPETFNFDFLCVFLVFYMFGTAFVDFNGIFG